MYGAIEEDLVPLVPVDTEKKYNEREEERRSKTIRHISNFLVVMCVFAASAVMVVYHRDKLVSMLSASPLSTTLITMPAASSMVEKTPSPSYPLPTMFPTGK